LSHGTAVSAVLGLRLGDPSPGLSVAVGVGFLLASLAVMIFERSSAPPRRVERVLLRACSLSLLVCGVGLVEYALLVGELSAAPLAASIIGAAFAATGVLVGARLILRAGAPDAADSPVAASSRREHSPGKPIEDWRWLVQLIDLPDLTELQQFIVERLTGVLHAVDGAILLVDATGSTYEETYSTRWRDVLGERPVLPADAPLVRRAAKRGEPIVRAKRARGRADAAVLDDLESLQAELVIPLMLRGRLLGIVAAGRCIDADGYSDAAVMRAMREAHVIAAAVENVRIFNLATHDKLRSDVLLEQLTIGVIATDHSGTIVACNRAAREILRLDTSPEGRPAATLGPGVAAFLDPGGTGAEPARPQDLILDVAGRGEVPVRLHAAAVGGALEAPGRIVLIEDLSEQRALESDLRGAKQLASVATLAAEMAHEIRNPLVSIKTFSQLLPERLDDQAFQLKFADIAQREVDAIGRIIDRLLNYAEPGKLRRAPTRLDHLARQVLDLLAPELDEQRVLVKTAFEPNSPEVIVDADKVKQVLRNVVANSLQAMPAGGRLDVAAVATRWRAGAGPAQYTISVRDSGCGIPKSRLTKVFDPFFTTRERGFGLGLSRAKHVMEEHGGSIDIDSAPGRGTTVTLVFPLAQRVGESKHSTL
jgi:signal transduction histidine kinase